MMRAPLKLPIFALCYALTLACFVVAAGVMVVSIPEALSGTVPVLVIDGLRRIFASLVSAVGLVGILLGLSLHGLAPKASITLFLKGRSPLGRNAVCERRVS